MKNSLDSQSAFCTHSAVCSLHFVPSLLYLSCLQSKVCILYWRVSVAPIQFIFYYSYSHNTHNLPQNSCVWVNSTFSFFAVLIFFFPFVKMWTSLTMFHQNSHLLTAKIGRWRIFQLSIFVLSREKCQHQSHWIRNFRFFFLYIGFSPSKKVWTSLSVSETDFFSVLDAIIRESSDKLPCAENREGSPFIHQPDRVAPKASDVSAADWLYQHTWKKNDLFSRVWLRLFSGRKSL